MSDPDDTYIQFKGVKTGYGQMEVLHGIDLRIAKAEIVTLIGATTENPSFEVIAPLLSRCRVFTLARLDNASLQTLLRRAALDEERGLGDLRVDFDDEVARALVEQAARDLALHVAALVGRFPPDEMVRVLEGSSERFDMLRPIDFYNPNLEEFAERYIVPLAS